MAVDKEMQALIEQIEKLDPEKVAELDRTLREKRESADAARLRELDEERKTIMDRNGWKARHLKAILQGLPPNSVKPVVRKPARRGKK